jgi:hypothetical protein
MARDAHSVDAASYNALVGRATLTNIRLTEAKFDIRPDALSTEPDTWRKEIRAEPVEVFADAETGKLYGSFLFELICRHRRKKVMSCSARYLVSYRVHGGCEPAIGELFVERVGKVVVYPYFRATVAQLTAQSAVQMPPLPIISLAPRSVKSATELEDTHPLKGLSES